MSAFDLPGFLRRIRRAADVSQRELARTLEVSKSLVGAAESGRTGLDVRILARAAAQAHLRLALLDDAGHEVPPMAADAVRDMADRRFPAHLDTRYGDEDWWHGPERYSRAQPWYTFDRLRDTRDSWRARAGTPDDHRLPGPADSPQERAAARRRAARQRRDEEHRRRLESGELRLREDFDCSCPAGARNSTTAADLPSMPPTARVGVTSPDCFLIRCYREGVRGSLLLISRGEALS